MLKVNLFILLLALTPNLQAQKFKSAKEYFDSSLVSIEKGDVDRALADLTRAIELDPQFFRAFWVRGQARFALGDRDGALADYDKVIELAPVAPGVDRIYSSRATLRALKGDSDGALKDLEQAISLNPKSAGAYSGRGNLRAGRGDPVGATADYERALELNPYWTPAYIGRGIQRFQVGDCNGAIEDYSKALDLGPKYPKTYIERGIVYAIRGDIDAAVADIKQGFALSPDSVSEKDPGPFNSPFKSLSNFILAHPKNARAYETRGMLRLLQGKKAEATVDFQKALALNPKLKSEIDKLTYAF